MVNCAAQWATLQLSQLYSSVFSVFISYFSLFKFGFDLGGDGKGRGQMQGNGGISWIRICDVKFIKNQRREKNEG